MSVTFSILAYSDLDRRIERQPLWGDFWFKFHLADTLNGAGLVQTNSSPDVLIHLFGAPMDPLPRALLRILWIHSHPDWLSPALLSRYDLIFCASRPFTRRLVCSQWPAEYLMIPTHMKPSIRPEAHAVVFVGNNRRNGLRKVVRYLLEQQDLLPAAPEVWGDGWEGTIPASWYRGQRVANEELNHLYASSAIVLNDHHDDMAREGFLNPRILDSIAAGALAVTDPVLALNELVDLPVYRNSLELAEHIRHLLEHTNERQNLRDAAWKRLSSFTYQNAVETIVDRIQARLG